MLIGDESDTPFTFRLFSYGTLAVIAVVFVALRLFVKLRIARSLGRDDYALMFALVTCLFRTFSLLYVFSMLRPCAD